MATTTMMRFLEYLVTSRVDYGIKRDVDFNYKRLIIFDIGEASPLIIKEFADKLNIQVRGLPEESEEETIDTDLPFGDYLYVLLGKGYRVKFEVDVNHIKVDVQTPRGLYKTSIIDMEVVHPSSEVEKCLKKTLETLVAEEDSNDKE